MKKIDLSPKAKKGLIITGSAVICISIAATAMTMTSEIPANTNDTVSSEISSEQVISIAPIEDTNTQTQSTAPTFNSENKENKIYKKPPVAPGSKPKPSASSNPSDSPVRTASSLNSTSALPTSEKKSLMFAEDDNTKAIFHIGMTREQVKRALIDNKLRIKPSDYGVSNEEVLNNYLGFDIIGGVDISYDTKTDLLNQLIIWPASDKEFSSPYETQKGLKIGDAVDTVRKLYGEPIEQVKYGDDLNGLGMAYYYDIPISLDNYYKVQTVKNKSDRGVYLRINISQSKGNNYNKVVTIIYAEKANN